MIPHPYVAQCLLCDRNFMTKQELDAHDRVFAAEHDAALSKGGRIDFGKSFTAPVEFVDLLGVSAVPTTKELSNLELAKVAAEPQDSPLEKIFDADTKHLHSLGKAVTSGSSPSKGVAPEFQRLLSVERW